MRLDSFPRHQLTFGPSPVHPLDRLSDHLGGAREAVRHLLALGHRRIAHIAGPAARFTGRQRRDGYEAALREAGIALPVLLTPGALPGDVDGPLRTITRTARAAA